MSFFYNYIFGLLEDNTGIFYTHWLLKNPHFSSYIGYPTGQPVDFSNTSEPLFLRVFFWLMASFNTVAFYNVFITLSLFCTAITAYLLFKHFTKNKLVSSMVAVLFTLSPYFYYQSRSHVTLIQFWLVILFVLFLIRSRSMKHFFLLGIYLTFVTLISNYFAYFCLLILGGYFIAKQIVYRIYGLRFWTVKLWVKYFICLGAFLLTTIPILMPYFNTFYGESTVEEHETASNSRNLNRTLEDFFIFSSRPWYFVLPSVDNPFLGNITNSSIDWLQNDWGYFLAQNYFKSEHSASFLGWANIALATFGTVLVIKTLKTKRLVEPNYIENSIELEIITLLFVGSLLLALTLPPYITVSEMKIYMPSYLLYKLFPMFRVLTRLGTVILLFTLIPTAYSYKEIINEKKRRLVCVLIILPIYVFSLAEFFIPIKLTNVAHIPNVFEYLKLTTPQDAVIAVYPYSRTQLTLFWIKDFERRVVNPRDFKDSARDFNSEEFTKSLVTCEGLAKAYDVGANYLVVFQNADVTTSFFNDNGGLEKIAEFEATVTPSSVYKLVNVSYAGADEASIVYKIRKGSCE